MTIRAVTASAAGIAVATLLVTMLVTGNSPMPRPEPTAAAAQTPGAAKAGESEAPQIADPQKRRDLRVLDNGCALQPARHPAAAARSSGRRTARTPTRSAGSARWATAWACTAPTSTASEVDEAVAQARVDLAHQRVPWISFKLPHSWGAMASGAGDAWALRPRRASSPGCTAPSGSRSTTSPRATATSSDWTAMQTRLGADRARGRTQRRLLGHPHRLEPALRRAPVLA